MDRNIVHFGAKSVEGFCPDFSEQTYVTSAWSPMYCICPPSVNHESIQNTNKKPLMRCIH